MRGHRLTICALLALLVGGPAFAADTVPTDLMMPGTQPNEIGNLESPDKCDNCHGGYDAARVWSNEPAFGWRGGAMGNAGRDPIFWATLAIAEQDFDGAGDLCIRCHSSAGWYGGRSTPTDGSGLMAGDDDGIDCDTCHKMTNPNQLELPGLISAGFEPYDGGEGYYGSGILALSGGNAKLGPFSNAEARHQFEQSAFHRGDICGSCHDVSNPAVGDLAPGNGAQPGNALAAGTFNGLPNLLDPGQDPTSKAAFNNPPYAYGIVERTFSEYKAGLISQTLVTEFPNLPADLRVEGGALAFAYNAAMQAGGTYEDGTPRYFNCQGCHMRPDTGEGCNKKGVPTRTDLPKHDQSGGNYWMWPLIQYQDQQGTLRMGGGLTPTQIAAMEAGEQRAKQQLQMAASLTVDEVNNTLTITNLTGHKLISGYPEGRRMWLNIKWYDANNSLVREDGAYGPLADGNGNPVLVTNPAGGPDVQVESILDLDDPNLNVFDAHYAITQEWANTMVTVDGASGGVTNFGAIVLDYDRLTGDPGRTIADLASGSLGTYRESFHFVLNNYVSKDNRIPPYGMSYDIAKKRNALPVPPEQYGNPGPGGTYDYHAVLDLNPPDGATYADITLYYQGTSWEYVQFLWLANNEQNAFLGQEGVNFLDAWLNADPAAPMVPPYIMATATWGDTGCAPTEQTEVTCDDGIDNDCDGLVDSADPDCAGCTPVTATDTTCDGIDDDCNGLIDDGYVPLDIVCGLGICEASGTQECVDGSLVDVCTPGNPQTEGPFGNGTCNDTWDNDCDGLTDLNDTDCQAVLDCTGIPNQGQCEAEPTCRWNRKKGCLNR